MERERERKNATDAEIRASIGPMNGNECNFRVTLALMHRDDKIYHSIFIKCSPFGMQCHKPSGTRSTYGTGIFSRSSFHISWMAFILMNGALVVHQHLTQMSRMFFICNFEHHFERRPFNVAWLACQPDRSNKRRYCGFYFLPFFSPIIRCERMHGVDTTDSCILLECTTRRSHPLT